MNFYVAILILKMEEKIFLAYYALLFQERQKRFVQCMEGCYDWSNVSKVVCEVSCWGLLTGRRSTVEQTSWIGQIVIKTLIKNNQSYTTGEIVDILKIFKSSIEKHLYQLGYVNCFDVWVPHKLSKKKPPWPYFLMWFSN